MEYLITLVSFIFSLNYIFLALYFIIYLILKRNSYPFHKCTTLCNLVCVSCVVLNQVLYLIMNFLTYFDSLIKRQIILAFHSVCVYLLFGIPFIIRLLEVSELIRFNDSHLTFESNNPNIMKESHEYYINRIQKPNQDLNNVRYSLIIIFSFFILFGLGLAFEPFKCTMLNMTSLKGITYDHCSSLYNFLPDIIKLAIVAFYILYYLYILASIFKAQISQDDFYIRHELFLNLLWIFLQFFLFKMKKKSYIDSFKINSLIDYFYIICQLYLFFTRKQMIKSSDKKIIQNYSLFMRNFLSFMHLKEYIQNSPILKNSIKLLEFWQEFYLYKVHTLKSNILKKSDLIIHAYILYNNYFKQDDDNPQDNHNMNNKAINIPIDIVDEIEEASKVGFCISRKDLGKVFDAAFNIINNKLNNLYFDLMKKEDEKQKLSMLFFYSEFDELKNEILLQ